VKPTRRNFMKAGATVGAIAGAGGLLGGAGMAGATLPAKPDKTSLLGKSFAETASPRMWTKPQRPTPVPISIDVHTHWSPAKYLQVKADLGQPDNLPPINYDMAQRLATMNKLGIKMSVVSLGGFRPWGWIDRQVGNQVARDANDAAIAAHAAYPQNYVAGIEVNCNDPVASLVELNRVAGKPGMVCLHLPTSLASRDFMFEDNFQPIFARCQELGLPILLHPLDGEPNWFAGKRLVEEGSGVGPGPIPPANRFPGLTNSLGNSLEVRHAGPFPRTDLHRHLRRRGPALCRRASGKPQRRDQAAQADGLLPAPVLLRHTELLAGFAALSGRDGRA